MPNRRARHAHPADRNLILRVWHVYPLRCPVFQDSMLVIALIGDPRVAEKILRHLGTWHDPSPRPAPNGLRLATPMNQAATWTRRPITNTH